eukprot:TRINITY_DN29141_c0_g2_i1.p1 TRINITY_DN29141_c0_g2~~TRINITY_DN29141_c0_g2_i1.p1  ORF type:complete len:459 (-),score=94.86 TRINITY_DN29141_c0_g2_i1:57-1256(-)
MDLEKACDWFQNFLIEFEELRGDDMMVDLQVRFQKILSEGRRVRASDIPGHTNIQDYCAMLYTAERPTLDGDPVCYVAMKSMDKKSIAEKAWKSYRDFVIHGLFMRALELDNLSRHQGRLCLLTTVIDVAGCGFSHLVCKEFDRRAEDLMLRLKRLLPDLTGGNWILNAPRFVHKLFPWVKRVLRLKLANWFLCSGNGLHEEALLESVDPVLLAEFEAERKAREVCDGETGSGWQYIGSGGVFERVVPVTAGQRITWSFAILPGARSLPQAELDFGVAAIWEIPEDALGKRSPHSTHRDGTDLVFDKDGRLTECAELFTDVHEDDAQSFLPEQEVVERARYGAVDGEVTGECIAAKTGMLVLRWSNAFNWVRAKALRYTVDEDSASATCALLQNANERG